MNRRDFLTLGTRGEERILELSCERLYMRYADAQSDVGRREEPADVGAGSHSWEGEPPMEIVTPTTSELFDELDRQLADADVLRVLQHEWLAGQEFGREIEARVETFRHRGGRVEFRESTAHLATAGRRSV